MTMPTPDTVLGALDILCPMHCLLDDRGVIRHAGPTLRKLRPDIEGTSFFDRFHLTRPRGITRMADLGRCTRTRLRLQLQDPPHTVLQGVLVSAGPDGVIVNLAFGISVVEAVQDYQLTDVDFAATDPTVEMLFLVEAKSAAMEASRKLTRQLQIAKIAAEEQAFTDTLTGLKNRRALDHVLLRLIGAGQEFALMHLDLDFFKQVNDRLGHAAGDHVLEQVARIMIDITRDEDVIARVGGDEFVLVFQGLCERARIDDLARRLIARLEQPMRWQGQECCISASAGTTLSTDYRQPEPGQMLADADEALYAAKRAGRSRHHFHLGPATEAGTDNRMTGL